jgi:hypothetical protein
MSGGFPMRLPASQATAFDIQGRTAGRAVHGSHGQRDPRGFWFVVSYHVPSIRYSGSPALAPTRQHVVQMRRLSRFVRGSRLESSSNGNDGS